MYKIRESVKDTGKGALGLFVGASVIGAGKAMIKTGNPLCVVAGCGFTLAGICLELSGIKNVANGTIDTIFEDSDNDETETVTEVED